MNITTNAFIIETNLRTADHSDDVDVIYTATYKGEGIQYMRESEPNASIVDFIGKVKADIMSSQQLFKSSDIVIQDNQTYHDYFQQVAPEQAY